METVSYITCFLLSLALRQDVRWKQPTERKKAEDVFSLLAEVRELRAAVTEKERSLQQKYYEDLKEMIIVQLQNLKNESKSP